MAQITLYGYLLCPFVQRTRFALEALKIDYEFIHIDLYANKNKEEAYLKINPTGQLPSVKFNNKIVYESLIVLEFFNDQFGKVFPEDNIAKAHQRIWTGYFNDNIFSKFWPIIGAYKKKEEETYEKIAKEILEQLKYFTKQSGLGEQIKQNPKSYFAGDKLTYIDFAITPFLRFLDTFYRQFIKKSILDYSDKDEQIELFKKYFYNVTLSEPYLAITDKLKTLPPKETNSLLTEMGVDSIENYKYEEFWRQSQANKFQL